MMESKKWAVIISGRIVIISFVVWVFMQFKIYILFEKIAYQLENCTNLRIFLIDLACGLFTGAFVTLLISIKEYKFERKKALEKFYFAIDEIQKRFFQITYFLPDEPEELVTGLLAEIENNQNIEKHNKDLKEAYCKSGIDNADELYAVHSQSLQHDAEERYKLYIWENMSDAEKKECSSRDSKESYLDMVCKKKVKGYSEQVDSSVDSFLNICDLDTKEMTLAYSDINFLHYTDNKEKIDALYSKMIDEINSIKMDRYKFEEYKNNHKGNRANMCVIMRKLYEKLVGEDETMLYKKFCMEVEEDINSLLKILNGKHDNNKIPSKVAYKIKGKRCF